MILSHKQVLHRNRRCLGALLGKHQAWEELDQPGGLQACACLAPGRTALTRLTALTELVRNAEVHLLGPGVPKQGGQHATDVLAPLFKLGASLGQAHQSALDLEEGMHGWAPRFLREELDIALDEFGRTLARVLHAGELANTVAQRYHLNTCKHAAYFQSSSAARRASEGLLEETYRLRGLPPGQHLVVSKRTARVLAALGMLAAPEPLGELSPAQVWEVEEVLSVLLGENPDLMHCEAKEAALALL